MLQLISLLRFIDPVCGSFPLVVSVHAEALWGCYMLLQCVHAWLWYGYGSIPIHTIFRGMNIHLPAILMFTRGTRFWHTAISQYYYHFYPFSPIQWSMLGVSLLQWPENRLDAPAFGNIIIIIITTVSSFSSSFPHPVPPPKQASSGCLKVRYT